MGGHAAIDLTVDSDDEAAPNTQSGLIVPKLAETASQSQSLYAACACDAARADSNATAQLHSQACSTRPLVSALLAILCPHCQGNLDRTAMQRIQPRQMQQIDKATVDLVAYEAAIAYPPADRQAEAAQPLCPFCPMSHMLPLTAPARRGSKPADATKTAKLPAYLEAASARQQAAMRNGHICLTCHAARSQMGQLFHPRSSTTAVKLGEAKSLKAPSTCTEAVQRQVERLADTCRLLFQNAKLALQLLNDDDRAVALGKAAGKRGPIPKKARTSSHHGQSIVWAAGTGFGGSDSRYFDPGQPAAAAPLPAQQEQQRLQRQERDRPVSLHLGAITDSLSEMAEVAEHVRLPYVITAVLHAGPLPRLLQQLLDHASLQDICARHTLFAALFDLLKTMGMHWDLLEVLTACGPAAEDAAASAGAASLLGKLQSTAQDAKMFNNFGNQLGEGSDADVESLGFSLHIAQVIGELRGKAAIMQSMADAEAAELQRRQDGDPVDVDEDESATTTSGGVASLVRGGRRRGKEQAGAAAEKAARAQAQAALEKRYVDTLQPMRYQAMDMMSRDQFYFCRQMPAPGSTDARNARKHIHQTQSLSRDLPVTWPSSIFVVQDENRFSALKALIIGPQDTPYQNGAFIFDIWLPPEFPDVPPCVQLLTTGGGRVRFNPNLYNCGKVCLSLLGTWAGPSWQPGVSTLLQVLVSIQSMILVKDPWFNEPGREGVKDIASSERYNRQMQRDTLLHAVLPALTHPPAEFADVLRQHYTMKQAELTAQCEAWAHASGQPLPAGAHHKHMHLYFDEFSSTGGEHIKAVTDRVKVALARLPG